MVSNAPKALYIVVSNLGTKKGEVDNGISQSLQYVLILLIIIVALKDIY